MFGFDAHAADIGSHAPRVERKAAGEISGRALSCRAELILSLVRKTNDKIQSLMIVGHNPGIEQCALVLAAVPLERKLRKRYDVMDEKFPTCALAVIDFEIGQWRDVRPGAGDLDAFVRPERPGRVELTRHAAFGENELFPAEGDLRNRIAHHRRRAFGDQPSAHRFIEEARVVLGVRPRSRRSETRAAVTLQRRR